MATVKGVVAWMAQRVDAEQLAGRCQLAQSNREDEQILTSITRATSYPAPTTILQNHYAMPLMWKVDSQNASLGCDDVMWCHTPNWFSAVNMDKDS